MTNEEMTKIFSVMLLAWPNSATFKGGIKSLMPTIKLWTLCLADIDFLTAQMAVIRMCQTCKFPPTIADFREAAEDVQLEINREIDQEYLYMRSEVNYGDGNLQRAYERMPPKTRLAIDMMGGTDHILIPLSGGEDTEKRFNAEGFEEAYRQVLIGGMEETVKVMEETVKLLGSGKAMS